MRVGFDVDGVLATWDVAFAKILADQTGRISDIALGAEPPMWEWPTNYGYTLDEIKAAWKVVHDTPGFWLGLPVMADMDYFALDEFHSAHEVYFITARRGAQRETAQWLETVVGLEQPAVICSRNKGALAKALQLNAFIDDMPEMCLDVAAHSPKTRTYLRIRAHNKPFHRDCTKAGVRLVKDLNTFLVCETHNARATSTTPASSRA